MRRLGVILVLLAALWVVDGVSAGPARAHEQQDEALPEPPLSMRVIAPSAQGPWLLRIDNEGNEPLRIAADVRLLSFEVRAPYSLAERRRRGRAFPHRAATCDGPGAFQVRHFPADREIVLEPGHSYVEQFDPRLVCFGAKADLLVPGAQVKPWLGWKPGPRWQRMQAAPFAADAAREPRKFRPMKRLGAPTMVLSHSEPAVYGSSTKDRSEPPGVGGQPSDQPSDQHRGQHRGQRKGAGAEGDKPAPRGEPTKGPNSKGPSTKGPSTKGPSTKGPSTEGPSTEGPSTAEEASRYRPRERRLRPRPKPIAQDELRARLSLTSDRYSDALRGLETQVSVQAHNVGERPLFIALRSRMLSFDVDGPSGRVECPQLTSQHKVPRDLFGELHHGKHKHMQVMLFEACPPGTFDRPGLYVVTPTLHAEASGREYGLMAATGVVTTREKGTVGGTHEEGDDATLVRVRTGRLPFYSEAPQSMPTRAIPD